MISREFREAIAHKNLSLSRIMLKNSLMVDPTFAQFNEMLPYAKRQFPDLFVPFDRGKLENDPTKWNINVINEEAVQLISNFSLERLEHLKRIISHVLKEKAAKICLEQSPSQSTSSCASEAALQDAIKRLRGGGTEIQRALAEVDSHGKEWKANDVIRMERAAKEILRAADKYHKYKRNK